MASVAQREEMICQWTKMKLNEINTKHIIIRHKTSKKKEKKPDEQMGGEVTPGHGGVVFVTGCSGEVSQGPTHSEGFFSHCHSH